LAPWGRRSRRLGGHWGSRLRRPHSRYAPCRCSVPLRKGAAGEVEEACGARRGGALRAERVWRRDPHKGHLRHGRYPVHLKISDASALITHTPCVQTFGVQTSFSFQASACPSERLRVIAQAGFTTCIRALLVVRYSSVRRRKRGATFPRLIPDFSMMRSSVTTWDPSFAEERCASNAVRDWSRAAAYPLP
jgi:hypothetical protein